ncbi:MAG: hypothetical protein R3F61_34115 [Myxococcota bacterium]
MRIAPILIALAGCTEEHLHFGASDLDAWEAAALRLASDTPADAAPWLRDIGPESPLHDDAVLLRSHPWIDRTLPDSEVARLASGPGPHAHDAVLNLANRQRPASLHTLVATNAAWGLSAFDADVVLHRLRDAELETREESLTLDTRAWTPDQRAAPLVALTEGFGGLSKTGWNTVLVRLAPLLDPAHPERGRAWTHAWFQTQHPPEWQRLLEEAPPHADVRWALNLRGQARYAADGDLTDFHTLLEAEEPDGYSAAATFYVTVDLAQTLDWGPDPTWTPEHEETLRSFEWVWAHGAGSPRSATVAYAGAALARKLAAVGDRRGAARWVERVAWHGHLEPSPEGIELAAELGLPVGARLPWEFDGDFLCCRGTSLPATTLVPVVDTSDGPRALPAFQPGSSPCGEPATALSPHRSAVAACVEAEIPWLDGHREVHVPSDADASDVLGGCLEEVARDAGIRPSEWVVRIVDRRAP